MSDDRQRNLDDLLARAMTAAQKAKEAWEELAVVLDPNRQESADLKAEAAAMATRTEAIDKRLRELLKMERKPEKA